MPPDELVPEGSLELVLDGLPLWEELPVEGSPDEPDDGVPEEPLGVVPDELVPDRLLYVLPCGELPDEPDDDAPDESPDELALGEVVPEEPFDEPLLDVSGDWLLDDDGCSLVAVDPLDRLDDACRLDAEPELDELDEPVDCDELLACACGECSGEPGMCRPRR